MLGKGGAEALDGGPPSDAPAPAPVIRLASITGLRRLLTAVVIVYVMIGGLLPRAPRIPPPGDIWFATSFDQESYDVQGRLAAVGPDDIFFMIGQLPRSAAGSSLVIRAYQDGQLIHVAFTMRTDETDIWAFSLGPLIGPGTWRYEIADVGGFVLASGQIEARK